MLNLRKEMGLERQPLLVKLAPDLAPEDLDAIVEVAVASGISGLIATNTTLDRGVVAEPLRAEVEAKGAGGLSGVPLKAKAPAVRRRILAALRGRLPLVACGGLGSAEDVREALNDGAALAQIYSALIFEGPGLIGRIHREL
jgi:dihydroorotate dehydrogenase